MQTGRRAQALDYYKKASTGVQTYVFPYRPESLEILEDVLSVFPEDAVANMYYGDLLYYLRRHDEALVAWEKSYDIYPGNYRVSRNLALGKFVKTGDPDETVRLLEESFEQSNKNLRIFSELEALYISQKRFDKLESHYDANLDIIHQKGDYALKAVDYYISHERYRDAANVLENSYFSAAEKALGTPIRHTRYVEAQIGIGVELLAQNKPGLAIDELRKAYEYPEYLNEARVNYPVTARVDYFLAMAYKMDNQRDMADKYFRSAIDQDINLVSVAAIYKARALKETGKKKEAEKLVRSMLDKISESSKKAEPALKEYLQSLAYDFLGEEEKAAELERSALEKDYNVAMEASYASSYLPENKFALE